MKGSRAFLFLAAALVLASGCGDDWDGRYGSNEIVFGIEQRTDPVSGKTEVAAGYEYLSLAHMGGWSSMIFRDGDGEGTCYFELFERRLGQSHVDSGLVRWTGGKLPAAGLQIVANQPLPAKHDGPAWGPGDKLTFEVTGFAMPRLTPVILDAPRTDLAITSVTPAKPEGATVLDVSPESDVSVTWTPTPRPESAQVMVTLETGDRDHPSAGVRCFGASSSGTIVIPKSWVTRLFAAVPAGQPVEGRLAVASHRQLTYLSRSAWTTYVVLTSQHLEQPFRGVR